MIGCHGRRFLFRRSSCLGRFPPERVGTTAAADPVAAGVYVDCVPVGSPRRSRGSHGRRLTMSLRLNVRGPRALMTVFSLRCIKC